VRADPDPNNCIASARADGAVLFVDADSPDVFITAEFLETQRRMIGILRKLRICPACRLTVRLA